eukprot:4538792-Prymnesium_polylepis.1
MLWTDGSEPGARRGRTPLRFMVTLRNGNAILNAKKDLPSCKVPCLLYNVRHDFYIKTTPAQAHSVSCTSRHLPKSRNISREDTAWPLAGLARGSHQVTDQGWSLLDP